MDELDQKIQKLFYKDWHVTEIAEMLNISTKEVKSRIKKMRKNGNKIKRWWKD